MKTKKKTRVLKVDILTRKLEMAEHDIQNLLNRMRGIEELFITTSPESPEVVNFDEVDDSDKDKKTKLTYKIWDKQEKKFWKPTYEAYNGKLEDLSVTPNGRLHKRCMNENGEEVNYDESTFPDRYEIVDIKVGVDDSEEFTKEELNFLKNAIIATPARDDETGHYLGRIYHKLNKMLKDKE